MKKILTIVLALATAFTLTACSNKDTEETMYTQIGTSAFSIVLPEGYAMTDDDFDENQIAYYYKDDESIDFDVYQWAKGNEYTLEAEAEYFAGEFGATAEPVVINEINGMKYISEEEYDESVYTVVNYMFEDESSIVELCFWTDDTEKEYSAVEEIINTLKIN